MVLALRVDVQLTRAVVMAAVAAVAAAVGAALAVVAVGAAATATATIRSSGCGAVVVTGVMTAQSVMWR